jgi:hypothetical protein
MVDGHKRDRNGTSFAVRHGNLPVKRHPHPKSHECYTGDTLHPPAHLRTRKRLARQDRAPDKQTTQGSAPK